MQNTLTNNRRWPAEWEPQDGVLLAWPHALTDWASYLADVEALYQKLAVAIGEFEKVLVVAPDAVAVRKQLEDLLPSKHFQVVSVATQDTWARDLGPITVLVDGHPRLLDFQFNGWGGKYAAELDNQITQELHRKGVFGNTPCDPIDLILEGGSIESDGAGTLLTTSACLLKKNRNPEKTKHDIEAILQAALGVTRFLWLEHGSLVGDDTDAHIDTLVRFAPNNTLLYVQCPDATDEHYKDLTLMEAELQAFHTLEGQLYRLLPLPWPSARYETDGHRLPLTYANFLIINDAVLMPIYNDPQDEKALAVAAEAFPGRKVIGIDCSVLTRQHGSLHCITMQFPQGVFA